MRGRASSAGSSVQRPFMRTSNTICSGATRGRGLPSPPGHGDLLQDRAAGIHPYLPKTHQLDELGKKCGDLHPAFRDIFPGSGPGSGPRATPEDRARFELLEAAYVDARYSMTYSISREDLDLLAACVREPCTRTDDAYRERIAAMAAS